MYNKSVSCWISALNKRFGFWVLHLTSGPRGRGAESLTSRLCGQKKHEQITEEQKNLTSCIAERQKLTQEFKRRTEMLKQSVEEEQHHYQQKLQDEKVCRLQSSHLSLVVSVISTHTHDTGKIKTPTVGVRLFSQTSQSLELFPPTVPRLTANMSIFF